MTINKKNTKNRTSAIIGWALYDWAQAGFPTTVLTFVFAAYFTQSVAPNKIIGTSLWGNSVAIAGLLIAILSPIVGAIADYKGRRKPWLTFFALLCIISSALLWFVKPFPTSANINLALLCIITGSVGLEIAAVFYNAMLSDIAPKEYLGRLSGWGWGLGYLGGLISLSIALFVFIKGNIPWLQLDTNTAEHIRICGPFVAAWFLIFGWPILVFTPDKPDTGMSLISSIRHGMKLLWHTALYLKNNREILKFLIARLFFIDGLNTIFAFGGIYAAGTFHMSMTQVIQFGITMNIGAGIGAAIFGWLDDYKGSKLTILVSLAIMILSGTVILFIHSQVLFWIFGIILSLCVGPVQASSRSLMIRLAPEKMMTEMFGLFAFSGKVTAFAGPWVLAYFTKAFDSQRVGISTTMIFLLVGGLLLCTVSTRTTRTREG